ncbi:hypothetical protein [Streptomyces aureus]|uniref:hypothetical protein n=1 Tax=Streptomyces aureus TaxID=193461 RepID=UPI00056572E1|nr:hypothetical protein [Streptomyces aureus]
MQPQYTAQVTSVADVTQLQSTAAADVQQWMGKGGGYQATGDNLVKEADAAASTAQTAEC